jgi:hypothetical protein
MDDARSPVGCVTVPIDRSIPDLLVHDVQEHLARGEAAEVLAEDLGPPALAPGRPRGAPHGEAPESLASFGRSVVEILEPVLLDIGQERLAKAEREGQAEDRPG